MSEFLSAVAKRVPRGGVPSVIILLAGAIIVLNYGLLYTGSVFVLSACYAIVTAGMAVQIGFSQQIAFSQSVFFGVGAYGVAMLNTHLHLAVLLATVVVMIAAALAALLLGSVVTRASGLALAVATLMLPLIAVGYVSASGYLGGAVGAPLTGTLWPSSSASTSGPRPRSGSARRAASLSCSCSAASAPPWAAWSTRAPSSSCRKP